MTNFPRLLAAAATLFTAGTLPSLAQRIHTGGDQGAYHRDFCPIVSRELTSSSQQFTCTTSSGTRENMERVRSQPRDIGYGQLDVFSVPPRALAATNNPQVAQDRAGLRLQQPDPKLRRQVVAERKQ